MFHLLLTLNSDGAITNLHHIWDTEIPEKLVGGYKISFAESWSKNLTEGINSGIYSDQKADWLSGTTLNDSVSTAMIWARDSNAYICSTVMPNGVAAVQGVDLGSAYYSSVIDIVELQIAKGE